MADFSPLDRPQIRSVMFYPRPDQSPAPAGGQDLFVPAADGAKLHARIYPGSESLPTIVFFHGNGEVVADYDEISLLYARFGLNFVACEYRGYGQSGGEPRYLVGLVGQGSALTRTRVRQGTLGRSGGLSPDRSDAASAPLPNGSMMRGIV